MLNDFILSDEATSALDADTETVLLDNLFRWCKERRMTLLVIAHKLTTISSADRITVMHKGTAVEEGTHEELMRRGGVYHYMFKAQVATK